MKKIYLPLLAIGFLAGMKGTTHGSAAPTKTETIYEGVTNNWIIYSKGALICKRNKVTGEKCCYVLCKPLIAGGSFDKQFLDDDRFDIIEKEYENQQKKKDTLQSSHTKIDEQVPGGNMIPSPNGGWKPLADEKYWIPMANKK
jgi:hypothetical protein